MNSFQSFARRIGMPRLDFEIDEYSRGKIMRASILPGIVLAAELVAVILELYYSPGELGTPPGFFGAPEIWQRVWALAGNIRFGSTLAVACLFGAGLFNWRRAEGTWMFLVAVTFSLVGLVIVIGLASTELVTGDEDPLGAFRTFSVWRLAGTLGLLAIGYFFLAYRGLADRGRTPVRRRSRIPPSDPVPMEG
jgi:hypothetical protein